MSKIITKAHKMVNVIIGLQGDLEGILIGLPEFDNDCECSYGYSHEININDEEIRSVCLGCGGTLSSREKDRFD